MTTAHGLRGSLGTYRALENAAIALGDVLPPVIADSARERVLAMAWDLKPAQRETLAELLDDIAHELGNAARDRARYEQVMSALNECAQTRPRRNGERSSSE